MHSPPVRTGVIGAKNSKPMFSAKKNSKILPKTHADGFYKGAIILENGMLRHNEGIITTEELIEIAEKAEKYTNPLVNFENI